MKFIFNYLEEKIVESPFHQTDEKDHPLMDKRRFVIFRKLISYLFINQN